MELMDKSLHQLYKLVYEQLHLSIPEWVVGKMAEAVSHKLTHVYSTCCMKYFSSEPSQTMKALHYLKANLNVLHRGRLRPL